jgi:type II secretory pathway pseudopilin PulG
MSNKTERRGFALPTAVLVIAVLAIMVASGFSLVSAERRSVADQKSQISAFQIAEQGLELYLIQRSTLIPGAPIVPVAQENVTIPLPGGYANVQLTRIRPPLGTRAGLYVARSQGVETAGAYAGTPQGVRTVAQYILWMPAPMQVLGGWTALSGLDVNGNSATLSGNDSGDCDGNGVPDSTAVAGVVVSPTAGYDGKTGPTSGNPPIDSVTADSVHIDWDGIVNHSALTATVTLPGGSWPTDAMWADPNFYPVIRANGDFTLPGPGRGTLIVTGNATVNGDNAWKGVILVGGNLTSNGVNGISGATISGLNVKLGMVVPPSTANGTKFYKYNSCEVARATTTTGALVTLSNTWVDNWVEY